MRPEATSGNGSKPPTVHSPHTDDAQGALLTEEVPSSPEYSYEDVLPLRTASEEGNRPVPALQSFLTPIDFMELRDGALAEIVEDPENPTRTLLAVWKDGQVRYVRELKHGGRLLMPLQRTNEILKRVRLPRGTRPYESVHILLREIESLISRCVVLPEENVGVLANFVLSTWLVDRLPIAPYVSLAGLPQSGKTTLLKVLSLVCRRPLLTADITSAAFYQACAQLTPTLLIDEMGTHGSNRALRHLLRMGTTRDVVAMRKNHAFHAYGAKVICWLEPPDDPALNSRCILIPMTEANNYNLVKPTNPSVEEQAAELQAQLLQFRFDHYEAVRPPTIPGAERLRPRTQDLLACLTAPCAEDGQRCRFLLQFFAWQAQVTREPLSPPQNDVLAALFFLIHQRLDAEVCFVADLTKMVNKLLEKAGERIRLQPRKVGAVLTSLGFTDRQRTNCGWTVWIDRPQQERVHELAKIYGVDRLFDLGFPISHGDCPLCEKIPRIHARFQGQPREGQLVLENNMGFIASKHA